MDKTLSSDQVDKAVKPFCAPDYHNSKVIAERVLGSLLLVLASPVILLIVAIVRLTSAGHGIYKQIRVGKDGREFLIYKVRTMYQDAEACGNPQWSIPGDSRITPVGRVLRFLHLDEFPQLINVARGEMSLIGPRPERPEFVTELSKCIPRYKERLAVLPGVTGLAQINLPPDESLKSVHKKVVLDIEYIEQACWALDIRILLCTAARMCGVRHGIARWVFGVCYRVSDEQFELLDNSNESGIAVNLDDTAINIPALVATEAVRMGVVSYCESNETVQDSFERNENYRLPEDGSNLTFDAKLATAPRNPR